MKIRVGYGLGTSTGLNDERFGPVVDALENLGWDSLWVSERIGGAAPDPTVAMAFAAGRTTRLKFGMSVMVLPGRNPVIVATQLATLDRMSGGRLLPAFGLGAANPAEQQAFGVAREDRAGWFNEALPLIRRMWTEESVDHDGARFHYSGLRVEPKPRQTPLEVWLGGIAPSELKRVGRLADGWLPSFITPDEAGASRLVVEQVAADHDREIEAEHFGALIPYSMTALPDGSVRALQARRPDLDVHDLVPIGFDALRTKVEQFVEQGFSKFVVLPLVEPADLVDHLADAASALLSLQN
jgi:probable F420-dependent oxidoreductase